MKNPGNLEIRWVKAHTTESAVAAGLLTEDERRINAAVDLMAKEAARAHLVPLRIKSALLKRLGMTAAIQRMQVAILEARREKWLELRKKFPISREGAEAEYEEYCAALYAEDRCEDARPQDGGCEEAAAQRTGEDKWEDRWDDLLEQYEKEGSDPYAHEEEWDQDIA